MTEPTDSPQPEPAPLKSTACLAAALAAVQSQLPELGKTETGKVSGQTKDGKQFSYEYKYADLASISSAIMPLLGANGLAFTAWPTMSDRNLVLRYHLLHTSGESLTGEYPISGGTAQQLGSSITYARRYCLCAVTGIAPDKDDDAAAAQGQQEAQREAQRAEQVAADSAEYTHAANAVQGSWAATVGEWNQPAAEKAFTAWSRGGNLREADARTLRAFAAYINATPPADIGADPAPPDHSQEPMTPRMRGQLFALMGDIGKREKGEQLAWINSTLGTSYESRSLVTREDAGILIEALKKGTDAPPPSSEPA